MENLLRQRWKATIGISIHFPISLSVLEAFTDKTKIYLANLCKLCKIHPYVKHFLHNQMTWTLEITQLSTKRSRNGVLHWHFHFPQVHKILDYISDYIMFYHFEPFLNFLKNTTLTSNLQDMNNSHLKPVFIIKLSFLSFICVFSPGICVSLSWYVSHVYINVIVAKSIS